MVSQVTIIWSAAAGAALGLGLVHALVWVSDRHARARLAFAVAALGLAGTAIVELQLLHAATPREWGTWVRWMHVPLSMLVIGMALFLRLYLRAGRVWLLAAVIATRALVLILNLFSEPSFNFQRIDAIGQVTFLGEQVTVVTGAVTGEHQWLALLTALLFPLFIVDIVITLWRRRTAEARRMALVVVGPVLASVVLSLVLTQLVIWRSVELPMLLIPPFFIAVAAMALEASRDVLRASRLARDLRESERRLELAANAAGAGLWTWDSSSGHLWTTRRARTLLGLGQAENVDPARVLEVVEANDLPELRRAVSAALERGGECGMQFRIVAPDGAAHWIAVHGMVELGPMGSYSLVRGVVRDVTAQRRAEQEANELRRRLAHAGRVTTLGQLSSALAHELSQPLSAIQQNAETASILLAREPVDVGELRAIIGDILRDDQRAVEVVQRLRTWLKQGHMRLEMLSLGAVARDVLALVRSEATAKHIALECAVPSTLPPVLGDRVHLSQVLLNLVMNALEASAQVPRARQRVSIAAGVAAPNDCCEVSVSDTGPGIPPHQLDEIFEPFFTSKKEGLGIGLSISRAIIEAHGGKLWAENEVHGGATFRFTVPLHAGQMRSR